MYRSRSVLFLLLLNAIIQQHPSQGIVPIAKFFPFSSQRGDTLFGPSDDGTYGPISLPVNFPFFNNSYEEIYQSNNGLFSFLYGVSAYTPSPFPLGGDLLLIAPFWGDVDTRGTTVNPADNTVYNHVYLQGRTPTRHEPTIAVLAQALTYVSCFFPRQIPFQPKMVITGTWYGVGYYYEGTDKLNTFQVALVTDGTRSFAFFLYNALEWTANTGTSGAYGQAGFNAGDGVNYKTLPYSSTPDVGLLVNASNVNVPGLFAFRIDTPVILNGRPADQTISSCASINS